MILVGAFLEAMYPKVVETLEKNRARRATLGTAGCTLEVLKQALLKGAFRVYLLRTPNERGAGRGSRTKDLEVVWDPTSERAGLAATLMIKDQSSLTIDRVGDAEIGQGNGGRFGPYKTMTSPAFEAARLFLYEDCGNRKGFIRCVEGSSFEQRRVRVLRSPLNIITGDAETVTVDLRVLVSATVAPPTAEDSHEVVVAKAAALARSKHAPTEIKALRLNRLHEVLVSPTLDPSAILASFKVTWRVQGGDVRKHLPAIRAQSLELLSQLVGAFKSEGREAEQLSLCAADHGSLILEFVASCQSLETIVREGGFPDFGFVLCPIDFQFTNAEIGEVTLLVRTDELPIEQAERLVARTRDGDLDVDVDGELRVVGAAFASELCNTAQQVSNPLPISPFG